MSSLVRIAICQLTCHPAIYTGSEMWPEEPFIPQKSKNTLSSLSVQGFPVDHLLEHCRKTYLQWHSERLRGILAFLKSLNPRPSLLLFPEGAIPYQCLKMIHKYSSETETTVLAGTHSLQKTKEAKSTYKELGLQEKTLRRLFESEEPINGVCPVFISNKTHLVTKKIFSPYEETDISLEQTQFPKIGPYQVSIKDQAVQVLPLICAEALNFPRMRIARDYDICTIIAYNKTPKPYEAIIKMLVQNKKIVAFCNEGKYGGSGIFLPVDERRPLWWFDLPAKGHLPRGDAILVADVDKDSVGVEVGVALPRNNFSLINLSSIVYNQDPRLASITKQIEEIRNLTDSSTRAGVIKDLLYKDSLDQLHRMRLAYLQQLAKNGQDNEKWWTAIGTDCILSLKSLEQIETELAYYCYSNILEESLYYDEADKDVTQVSGFLSEAQSVIKDGKNITAALPASITAAEEREYIIDREADASSIVQFLDNPRQCVAQMSGMQGIGKSAAIEKALKQGRYSRVEKIAIQETSSAEYIAAKVLKDPLSKPVSLEELEEEDFRESLNGTDVLWIHNAENLLSRTRWRNNEIAQLFLKILKAAIKANVKVFLETRATLPLEFEDASLYYRRRIHGLERKLTEKGVDYLDYQLRRVGLSPVDYDYPSKEKIVNKLGGHPTALALCADAICDEGTTTVMKALEERTGFYGKFIKSLLRNIAISDDERIILNLLSGCRLEVPREAILETFSKAVTPCLRNLMQYCLIEIGPGSNLRLPGILSSYFYFDEVVPEIRNRFHKMCAKHYKILFSKDKSKIEYAIEADLQEILAGGESRLSGDFIDSQLAAAQNHFKSQEYREAKKTIDKVIPIKKTNDILRLSALIDAKCNSFDSAILKAKKVFVKNPNDTWLLSEIARTALSQGRDDIAEKLVTTARNAQMEDDTILVVYGRMLLRRNELQNAEMAFERACKITKRNGWAFYYLGKIYIRLDRLDDAIDVLLQGQELMYERGIKSLRVLSAIQTQLGLAYLYNEDIDKAEPILATLFEEQTENPEVMRAYAFLSLKKEGIESAHEAYEKLGRVRIKSRFDRSQYHLFYGMFYLGIEEKGKASQEFEEAHKLEKNNVYIMMKLARTYYDMAVESWVDGDLDVAKKYAYDCAALVRKILKFDSDNKAAVDLQIGLYSRFEIEVSKIEMV
ncbi:hypothetical protein DRJ22_05050 [Candidatus Woesearchaeota archaeon]|nr:MAG: hypothetical protein DRJ22_05050 [Candidatus Woesearchaeota archaeon]